MKWFGVSWDAPVCDETEHVKTPVGKKCGACRMRIQLHDRGLVLPYVGEAIKDMTYWNEDGPLHKHIAYHVDCMMRNVLGPDVKTPDRVPKPWERKDFMG